MSESDLELVRAWLAEPHVARWYLAGSTVEREVEELRRCVVGAQPTRALVVTELGVPIGWCQWYLCRDYPDHAAAIGAGHEDVGLDFAIGDPARVGQGLGTELIATLVAAVRGEHPEAAFVADPEASNLASRRALEKNGFELVRKAPLITEPTDAVMAVYRLAPSLEASDPSTGGVPGAT